MGAQLEGWPSKAGLDAMLASFGWTFDYFDWPGSGLVDSPKLQDYRSRAPGDGRRLRATIPSHPTCEPRAVRRVFERQEDRRTQWIVIVETAAEFGMSPQALAVWVRQAERGGGPLLESRSMTCQD